MGRGGCSRSAEENADWLPLKFRRGGFRAGEVCSRASTASYRSTDASEGVTREREQSGLAMGAGTGQVASKEVRMRMTEPEWSVLTALDA